LEEDFRDRERQAAIKAQTPVSPEEKARQEWM
jgi:hypothetical protein